MLQKINDLDAFCKKREGLLENSDDESLFSLLQEIKKAIKSKGDEALIHYTQKFDGIKLTRQTLCVTKQEIKSAYETIDKQHLEALKKAHQQIATFHQEQKPKNWQKKQANGSFYGNTFLPLDRVALYVPGGRNPYPSSVLMNAIPAQIAGVPEPIILTPPNTNGQIAASILVAADLCGITHIYKAGGAQAIFAAAYGCESIKKVDKITGPGNRYVTAAKQNVYGIVDIDKPAGPSEVAVYCDNPQYAAYAAAECLAQMEHDPLASAVMISTNSDCLEAIQREFKLQLETCKRKDIILKALHHSGVYLCNKASDAIEALNRVASEHVVIMLDNSAKLLKQLRHGASVFIGPHTPVASGDYFSGPNHVLPTNGAARYASPLGVMDFMKYRSESHLSLETLQKQGPDIIKLAQKEKLDAHANSVHIRLK